MKKQTNKKTSWHFEKLVLITFAIVLGGAIVSAWGTLTALRNTLTENNEVVNSDIAALTKIEKIRNLAEMKTANARAYFLLGSKSVLDEQEQQKLTYQADLANYEKQHPFPQVPEIIKKLLALETQHQEIFDQAMKYREKKEESKIVGQFFQSKVGPIRTSFNASFDELTQIANEDLNKARGVPATVEGRIGQVMTVFTAITVFLVFGLMLVIVRMALQRSRHQAERNRLYEEAKKANQARDELMVAISNDLKSPLIEINQNIESISNTGEVSSFVEGIDSIKRSVNETEGLIKDIVDQAKAGDGRLTLRLDQLGVNDVLTEARYMLEPLAKSRDIRLQVELANPPILAFFDRERVLRVLWNLVGNAVKFSPKHSKVGIRVRSDQQFVYVSVTDNGPGIPEKQRAQIFDYYWQAPKTAEQGAGVGLAVVKTIVEAHGGTVRVDNPIGSGSTLTFTLPRRRPVGAVLPKSQPSIKSASRIPVQDI